MGSYEWFTGIDPGKQGAIVSIGPNNEVRKRTIPVFKGDIDLGMLCNIIDELVDHIVCLELIHAIFGASKGTMFTMGRGLGNIEAALHCKGVNFEFARPKEWQKAVWSAEDWVGGITPSGRKVTDTKATSLNAAQRLYPDLDLRYADDEKIHKGRERSKPHDGIVDALLIAHFIKKSNI